MNQIQIMGKSRGSIWIRLACVFLSFPFIHALAAQTVQEPQDSDPIRQARDIARLGDTDSAVALLYRKFPQADRLPEVLDAIGAVYLLKPDFKLAIENFKRSIALDPSFRPAHQNLGIALYSIARYDQAAAQFEWLAHQGKTGHSDTALMFLGLIAARQHEEAKAFRLLDGNPALASSPEALLALAEVALHLHKLPNANAALTRFDAMQPAQKSLVPRAESLKAQLSQRSEARGTIEADARDNNQPDLYLRASSLYAQHRLSEARKILDPLSLSQPSAELFMLLADVATEQSDYAVAMKSLKTAAKLDPSREDAYLEFSGLCSDHGNDQLALESAEVGLNNIPGSYRLLVQKAAALDKLGRAGEAETVLREAAAKQANNSVALLSLGVVLAHESRLKEAEEVLAQAIQVAPENGLVHYYRGKLLLQLSSVNSDSEALKDAARQEFEAAIKFNPSHADSYYQLSTLYDSSQVNSAEQALRECLKIEPDHSAAEYTLARVLLRTGRKSEGETLLARFKAEQHAADLKQNKQLRIDAAAN